MELRTEIGQLLTELRSLPPQLTAWPEALTRRLAVLFRTEQQRGEERAEKEVGAWRQERAGVSDFMNQAIAGVQGSATRLDSLWNGLLARERALFLGLSWQLLQGLGVGLVAGALGALIYIEIGRESADTAALSKARATLTTYRQLWDTATAAEQKEIEKRLADKTPPQ